MRVLVTAGPTREPLDPVRFISNHSTGKMGYALAKAAMLRGADVTLVTGGASLEPQTETSAKAGLTHRPNPLPNLVQNLMGRFFLAHLYQMYHIVPGNQGKHIGRTASEMIQQRRKMYGKAVS